LIALTVSRTSDQLNRSGTPDQVAHDGWSWDGFVTRSHVGRVPTYTARIASLLADDPFATERVTSNDRGLTVNELNPPLRVLQL